MTLPADTFPPATLARRRRGRTVMKLAGLLGLISFALMAIGGAIGWPLISGLFGALTEPRNQVPGAFTQELDERDYLVSVLASRSSGGSSFNVNVPVPFQLGEVVVVDPDGRVVELRSGSSETVTLNNDTFRGVARFTAEQAGTYRITIEGNGASEALVTPSIFGTAIIGIVLWVLGVLLAVVAIVLATVGFIFSRSKPPSQPGQPVPPPAPLPHDPPSW